jgi:DNA mismatch endonuclease (patch repair protein)
MSRIRGRDTRPELLLRRALHARGLRYRLNVHALPGRPDLVFPAKNAVVFVHGCFWHQHGCERFKWPTTRKAFWKSKLQQNHRRDAAVLAELHQLGWRTLTVWECAITGPGRLHIEALADRVTKFLEGNRKRFEVPIDGRGQVFPAARK